MNNFGQYTVSSFLPPLAPLSIQTGVGWEYIRIVNNSSYLLNINLSGMGTIVMPEYFLEDIYLPSGYRGSFVITPQINVSVVSHSTSNMITINGYQHGEIAQPQAQPLSQPAVTSTASGKPLFSATYGVGSTLSASQTLNIFNPPNSGVTYTFHSVRIFTSDATKGNNAQLGLQSGGDINLAVAIPAVSHSGSATPPVSTAHVTAVDSISFVEPSTVIEIFDTTTGVTGDFLTFPDIVTLQPGNNLALSFDQGGGGSIGYVVRLTLKWSEDIIFPPQGGVLTGMAITTLVNQGFPSPTPIVTASPVGDGATATLINNNGSMTLGDALHAGDINMIGAGNPAIDLSATSIVQGIKFITGSLTRISVVGATAVAVAGTAVNHGLGVVPDFVIPMNDGGGSVDSPITVNYGTMTTTQFTAYAAVATSFTRFLCIKF